VEESDGFLAFSPRTWYEARKRGTCRDLSCIGSLPFDRAGFGEGVLERDLCGVEYKWPTVEFLDITIFLILQGPELSVAVSGNRISKLATEVAAEESRVMNNLAIYTKPRGFQLVCADMTRYCRILKRLSRQVMEWANAKTLKLAA